MYFTGTGVTLNTTSTIGGGNGGNGGFGGSLNTGTGSTGGIGGNGGNGGAGVSFAGSGSSFASTSGVTGGRGGDGGRGDLGGGNGGNGGAGVSFAGSGSSFNNTASVMGGRGGNGGQGGTGPAGGASGVSGNGGTGVSFAGSGSSFTNTASVIGGNGGNGGFSARGGNGGNGGTGVSFAGSGSSFTNTGTVLGGNGGQRAGGLAVAGAGGVGVVGAGLTIDNTGGTILGGLANDGTGARAFAVQFNGGTNAVGYGGTITGGINITNGSSFMPAVPNSAIGTALAVTGPVTFAPGTSYVVRVTPTANDRTTVTGTATLGNAAVSVQAGAGTYAATNTYTILSATALSGTFGTVTSNMAFLTPSLSYPNNSVVLTLTQTAPVQSVGTTPNQTGTGTAVQSAVPTTQTAATTTTTAAATTQQAATTTTTQQAATTTTTQQAATTTTTQQAATTTTTQPVTTAAAQVASAVLTQTAQGAVQALNSLSGEVQASAVSAQVQTAFLVQEAILDHLRFGEGNGFAGGFGGPGLTGSIGQRFAPGTTLPAMYSADRPGGAPVSLVPVRPVQPNYALWGQGFGAFGATSGNGNAARLTRQTGGFVLGIETGFGALANALVSDLRVGVAAGYTFTSFDVNARQSTGSVESGFGAVYARGSLGPVQVRVGAAYAGNALDTRRTVLFPGFSQAVTGKTGGQTVNGFGEVGYRVGFSAGYVEPFVGGAAIHIRRDGFSEVGGASALTVYGRGYDVETATAGVQGQAVLSGLFGTATPIIARGLIGYRRAFGDVVPQALLAFGGGGQAFLTSGVPIARNAVVASAGLDVQVAANVTVGLAYTGQVGDRAQDHAVKGSFAYRW